VLPGIVGLVQATEAVKLLLNIGEPLIGRLLMYDSLGMKFREFKSPKDAGCALCGPKPTILELEKAHAEAGACAVTPKASAEAPRAHAGAANPAPVAQRR
jgi:sulfur-carrier protein adenylyltransferase/sulfurtransferase